MIEKRNRIKCAKCGDIIESKSVHDFKECKCGSIFVDGGHQYGRWGGNFEHIIDMCGKKPKYWNSRTQKWDLDKPFTKANKYTKEELKIINKYEELARLNPNVNERWDKEVYVFVKIMFEHPLADGNKRLACNYLLSHLGVNEWMIGEVLKSLGKEIA